MLIDLVFILPRTMESGVGETWAPSLAQDYSDIINVPQAANKVTEFIQSQYSSV